MKPVFFSRKSEMTHFAETAGGEIYRTRLSCLCGTNNRRDGIIILSGEILTCKLIRCRTCAGKEAQHGTV